MARDWRDLFLTGDAPAPRDRRGGAARSPSSAAAASSAACARTCSKTREALSAEIQATLFERRSTSETWERLEEALIMADVGARDDRAGRRPARAGGRRPASSRAARRSARASSSCWPTSRGTGERPHRPAPRADRDHGRRRQRHRQDDDDRQARLAPAAASSARPSLLGAADTFRAAAVEQLDRAGRSAPAARSSPAPEGSDPGSVAFEAVKRGRERGVDVVIIDTAGRLHNQDDLMAELDKIRRVIAKQLPGAPHETLLTVDATTGPERRCARPSSSPRRCRSTASC